EANDSPAHRELAARAARESIVLLKNEDDTLPLKKDLKTVAVIGPNADSLEVLLGNYNGIPSRWVTPLEGIRRKVSSQTRVLGARADDGVRVSLGDRPLVETWRDGSAKTLTKAVELEAGRAYKLRVEYYEHYASASAKLVWGPPGLAASLREEALKAARESDVVVKAPDL